MLTGTALLGIAAYTFIRKPSLKETPPDPVPAQDVKSPPLLNPPQMRKMMDSTMDANSEVRWEAARFLLQVHSRQAEDRLSSMMIQDPDAGVRKNIIIGLSDGTNRQFSKDFILALRDIEPDVRVAALQALSASCDTSCAPAVSEMLQDADEHVRLQALNTLNELQKRRGEGAIPGAGGK